MFTDWTFATPGVPPNLPQYSALVWVRDEWQSVVMFIECSDLSNFLVFSQYVYIYIYIKKKFTEQLSDLDTFVPLIINVSFLKVWKKLSCSHESRLVVFEVVMVWKQVCDFPSLVLAGQHCMCAYCTIVAYWDVHTEKYGMRCTLS